MTTRSRSTVVCIQDAGGNTITTASDTITLTIATGPASSAITGGGATATASGVATFASVKLDKAGSYTLKATGGTYGNEIGRTTSRDRGEISVVAVSLK